MQITGMGMPPVRLPGKLEPGLRFEGWTSGQKNQLEWRNLEKTIRLLSLRQRDTNNNANSIRQIVFPFIEQLEHTTYWLVRNLDKEIYQRPSGMRLHMESIKKTHEESLLDHLEVLLAMTTSPFIKSLKTTTGNWRLKDRLGDEIIDRGLEVAEKLWKQVEDVKVYQPSRPVFKALLDLKDLSDLRKKR